MKKMKRRVRKSRSTGKKSAEEKTRQVADAIIDALPEETTEVMESMIDGVTITDPQGRITYINKAASLQLGYTKKETIGKTLRELFIAEQDLPKFLKQLKLLLSGKPIQAEEYLVKRKDGMQLVASFNLSVLRDAKGKPKAILVFHRDVTERKRAEKKLCESEKKYKELVELLPEMVFELDTAGRVIFANQAAFSTFGYSERDLGVSAIQMFVPQDRERAKKNIMGVLSGEKLGVTEYTALRKDGSTFPVIIHSTPIIRENKPVGLRGIIVDITERKLAEEERLKREKVFRMGEDITGSIIKKFGVGITSEELGLNDILSQFSELAVYPSPLNLFNLLTAGTSVVLRREGVNARKKEVREFLAPLVQRTLKEIFVIAEEFKRDIPSEYKDFEKTLETMCS
ncbi:MAG: PAS domain-containing protein [Hadesarchaea archaeon]|nr:PAS domain-containing protein [Hadesarchaea archaeon]MDH5685975.1 PAS domain-containing protein [Hadesarchaea archaeon]